MAKDGRDLWIHLAQSLPTQGQPEQGAQEQIQKASEDYQGGD